MNITFLIGNGFDINIGMNTRYNQFYDYYKVQSSKTQSIIDIKKSIEKVRENWSDLEIALGHYTDCIKTESEAIEIYNDLISNLQQYLKEEESKYDINDSSQEVIRKDFMYPENYLRPVERSQIQQFKHSNEHWFIKIITFNYTSAMETLIGYPGKKILIKRESDGYERYIESIEHIHGYTKERMILGVNDDSQLTNETFRDSDKIKRRFVKSDCNKTYGIGHDANCERWINESQLICLYGLSFGDTDKRWWVNIGRKLLESNCSLIIFVYNKKIHQEGNWGPEFEDEVDAVKAEFLSKTQLSEKEQISVRTKVFVAISSNIFNIKVSQISKDKNRLTVSGTMKEAEQLVIIENAMNINN